MDKAAECSALRDFRLRLPADTYLAELLDGLIPQFERDIRSDFLTRPNLREIERETEQARLRLLELRRNEQTAEKRLSDLRGEEAALKVRVRMMASIADDVRTSGERLVAQSRALAAITAAQSVR